MIDRLRIELSPGWTSAVGDGFRHQIYGAHRWGIDNVSHDEVSKLAALLKGVGTLKMNLEAFPASIDVSPYVVADGNVNRIDRILVTVFGEDCR